MGFDTGNQAPQGNNVSAIPANRKAFGFLNLYLPGQNGERKKLGTIQLKENTPNEKALAVWLAADGNEELHEKRLDQLVNSIIVDFNLADKGAGNGFALLDNAE